jgi:TRAP-type C4-dicarboxylate transport system permease large subunit
MFLVVGTVLDVSPRGAALRSGAPAGHLAIGIDPIFFGVVMVFRPGHRPVHPPVGTTMMISAYLAEVPF